MEKGFEGLDPSQERAVMARGNTVVHAGAGSGKTRVLAARYVRLVREGVPLESILALTFTRKAAGEMRSRIREALRNDPEAAVRRKGVEFDRAEICTFDSFCARIARSGCRRWGISPDFAQDEEAMKKLASDEAFSFILEHRRSDAFKAVVAVNGFQGLRDGVLAMVAKHMAPSSPLDFASMPDRYDQELEGIVSEALAELSGIREMVAEDPGKNASMDSLRDALSSAIPSQAVDAEACREYLSRLISIRAAGKSDSMKAFKEWKDKAAGDALKALAARERSPLYRELCALIDKFQDRILAAKRAAGIMGFHDVALMARDALICDIALRSYYKARIKAVMVDEFQDDNALQKEILYLICERGDVSKSCVPDPADLDEGKLFFVGDEKQSIYRFRGADVSVFRSLSRELGRATGDLSLDSNYRSAPGLIAFFNAVFPYVMANASQPWEAEYAAIKGLPGNGPDARIILLDSEQESAEEESEGEQENRESPGINDLHRVRDTEDPDRSPLKGAESQAWAIADFINDSVEGSNPLFIRSKDGNRRAAYGDFAVLVRSTNLQAPLERFFRLKDVPYAAQGLCAFWSDAPANDLLAALRAAVYPDDRNALAAFLRSPFARLGDGSIARILLGNIPSESWKGAVDEEDGTKADRAAKLLAEIRASAEGSPVVDIVYVLWHEKGYRDFVLRRKRNRSFAEYFEYAFALARRADAEGKGLAGFIAQLEELSDDPSRLKELDPPRESRDGVRIMTVHAAKGLEFPVVVIPDLEYRGADREGSRPAFVRDDGLISVKLAKSSEEKGNIFYERAKKRQDDQAVAEIKRLLYVACTRAESHLVLARVAKKRAAADASFWAHLSVALEDPGVAGMVERRTYPTRTIGDARELGRGAEETVIGPEELAAALASSKEFRISPARREFAVTEINEAHVELSGLGVATGSRVEEGAASSGPAFGSLAHEIIRAALDAGGAEGDAESADLSGEAVRALSGLSPTAEAEARSLAEEFLKSDTGRRAVASGTMRTEVPFLMRVDSPIGPAILRGAIDLLFFEGDACVVVDYKTDLTRSPGAYAAQITLYMEAAKELSGKAKAEGILYFLRSGETETIAGGVDTGPALASLLEREGRSVLK